MDATDAGENATAALDRAESRLAAAEEALADARSVSEAGADERPTGGRDAVDGRARPRGHHRRRTARAGLLNVYRRVLYALGVPFTAGQIAIWAVMGMPDMHIAVIDKPIQVALILLLAYLFLNERRLVDHETRTA